MSKLLPILPLTLFLLTTSCAWSTEGRGPVFWLSFYTLDQRDDSEPTHTPTDPMPEYHHTGEKPVVSIDPGTAGRIMFVPALIIDVLVLPFTAIYAAFDQSWREPEPRRLGLSLPPQAGRT